MAKNTSAKPPTSGKSETGKTSKLPGMLVIISVISSIALLALLLAADQNINFLNSAMFAAKYGIALISGLCIFALLGFFMSFKSRKIQTAVELAERAALKMQIDALISKTDEKIENYLGSEYQRLKSENENLQQQIEQVEKEKEADLAAQIEELRKKNTELQEQINNWAAAPQSQISPTNSANLPTEDSLQVG